MTQGPPGISGQDRSSPTTTVADGRIRGVWRGDSAAFLGIPFAAPPVGELRFDRPHRPKPWNGVLDATRYGPTPQRRPFAPATTVPEPSIPGESTLNVNVFTPVPGDGDARLPVFVWVHGGGYFAGSPASPWYDGRSFNREGVVTVSVSYRLGFDGFGWIEDAPPNRGVLDLIAALQWVRDNIERFGGDPGRVVIGGQSAGGAAVLTLMGIPATRDLFAGAVCQSGVAHHPTSEHARELGVQFAQLMGVAPTRSGWSARSEDEILDGQSAFSDSSPPMATPRETAVQQVRMAIAGQFGRDLAFVPHIDDRLVFQGPVEAISAGIGGDKPLLIGATAHEFTASMASLSGELSLEPAESLLADAGFTPHDARRMVERFPGFDQAALLGQAVTEHMFRIPALAVVRARTASGDSGGTWMYDFRWPSPIDGLAGHCYELPFVWDLLDAAGVDRVLGDDPPRILAEAMHRSWVSFCRSGDPGWPQVTSACRSGVVFDGDGMCPIATVFELEELIGRDSRGG